MRGQDLPAGSPAEGVPVVTRTAQCFVADMEAPPGPSFLHRLRRTRRGVVTGRRYSADDVPPRGHRCVGPGRHHVGGRELAAAPGCDGVRVARQEGRAPERLADGTPVKALPTGFTDAGLRTGAEYFY